MTSFAGRLDMPGSKRTAYRAVGKAFASDFVPERLRARAIGWYSTTVGLASLAASIVAGLLWIAWGTPQCFTTARPGRSPGAWH